mmetsp:Transcript_154/g.274  ORF Transcript_154/g.274 Transcript_154/m.274 type:complete len:229 (-) Transcript_154:287-973(-)|eukprot:CAMPEP_0172319236 /NCGR_PEP_ID=MMETSP1058-20130122/37143_1 /TAXON_ID=83371 /ORGANISM="Detonula confervacea, Strain CCMP 353" /LENGTH=228 /DNA_ID=CAMNT_0013034237 /DNA_START=82 /DNA_END=768 /DNA_ORIENTATION=+
MPTIAETFQVKRLLSDLLLADGGEKSNKRHRVRFDDNVEVLSSSGKNFEDGSLINQTEEEEEVDFVLSIGEDGEWDYTITTTKEKDDVPPSEEHGVDPLPFKKSRPASPFAGCDRRLCEELYMTSSPLNESRGEAEELLFRVNSNSSLGNNLTISITACNDHRLDSTAEAVMPMPLITPPSSPRTIRTVSYDGVTTEEATICEWPCNLTVDNAITAALELAPLSLPLE